jgi:benzoyl-CoA reductase/2-hydroxyglutaryl-CoA dehydratase subunit BcrC/BadD/HgdB
MYTELFKMCGFEEEEIERQRPRIEKVLSRIEVDNEAAIKHSEETVRRNFDIELKASRKFLWVMMNEFIDAVLAKEENEKVIYMHMPIPINISQSVVEAIEAQGAPVYMGSSLNYAWLVLGNVFDKVNWLIEAGELLGQTAGRAHCAHYQIYAGALAKGILPKPDLEVGSGLMCDQSAEANELMAKMYDFPIIHLDCPVDWAWDLWPDLDPRAVQYVRGRVEKVFQKIDEITGVKVTDEAIVEALTYLAKTIGGYQTLVEMIARADPQPISQADMTLAFYQWSWCTRYKKQALNAFNTLIKEVKKDKINKGIGVVEKGAPRVYVQLRTNVDMTPMKAIEALGLSIPIMFMDKLLTKELPTEQPSDLLTALGEGSFRRPHCSSVRGVIEYWEDICNMYEVDGMILMYQYSCRPWATPPLMGKKDLQKKLDIPILVVEGDSYDTRNYSAGQLRTRIESFAEILRMEKKAKAA